MSTIDIRTIKILLDTNIPGAEVIPLTNSILYESKKKGSAELNDLPYFTMDVEYPESYLITLSYTTQKEFFFNKKKMTEILQLKSKIKSVVQEDGLVSRSVEQKRDTEKLNKSIEAEQKEDIEIEQLKQKQIQKEEDEKSEKRGKLENIETQEKEALTNISTKLSKGLQVIESNIIKQIDGKSQINNKPFMEYVNAKKADNEELSKNVKTVIGFDSIKDIFKPNEEYLKASSGGFFFGFGQSVNRDNVDENNLYKDEFCASKQRGNNVRLFEINDSTPKWEPYKEKLLLTLKSVASNPLFDIPSVDGVIKVIGDIETITIDYDKYNSTEGEDAEKWKGIDDEMCGLLSKIRKAFEGMKELQTLLEKYPEEANRKIDVFLQDYNKKKAELEQNSKRETEKIRQSFFEKKNGAEMFGGGDSDEISQDEISHDEIAEKNIMIMIRLLFPTKYPTIGNVFSSFHSVITGKNEFHLKWTDFIPGFLKQNLFEGMADYSYIKVNEKVYTVIQAIWLNDIYNHKEYKQLVEQFQQLQKWKMKEARKSELAVLKRRDQIIETFTTNPEYELNELDIKNIQDTLKTELSSRDTMYSLAEYQLSIRSLIDIMRSLMVSKNSKNKDSIIEYSKKFSDLFMKLQRERVFNPSKKQKYEKIAAKIKEDIDKYEADRHVLKTYLQSPGINMDYERDEYRQILEEKYGLYVRFIENIRKYRAPVLESSNHFLQNSIDDFLNKTERYKGVFNFLMNPLNMKKNPYEELLIKNIVSDVIEIEDIKKEQKQYLNRFNTGVTIRPSAQENEPYYEIYIQLNVLGGELNDANKSVIDCMYQGESLGDKLSRILNEAIYHPWNINSSRIFFDITQGDAKNKMTNNNSVEQPQLSQRQSQQEPEQEYTESQQGGGKKSIRKYRELFLRKTRKHYSA